MRYDPAGLYMYGYFTVGMVQKGSIGLCLGRRFVTVGLTLRRDDYSPSRSSN